MSDEQNIKVNHRNEVTVRLFIERMDNAMRQMEHRLEIMDNRIGTLNNEMQALKRFVGEAAVKKMGSGPTKV